MTSLLTLCAKMQHNGNQLQSGTVFITCFIKIQIGLIFLLPVYPGCLGKEAIKIVYWGSIHVLHGNSVCPITFYINLSCMHAMRPHSKQELSGSQNGWPLATIDTSAVTIFLNDIQIATLDQNRKKIESSILPSQSYNFHESKKVRLMTDVSKLHCIL